MTLERFRAILEIPDRDGNRLELGPGGTVNLFLDDKSKCIQIGRMSQNDDGTIVYEKSCSLARNVLKKPEPSWCINHHMLKALARPDVSGVIRIRVGPNRFFAIPAAHGLAEGKYVWHKGAGYERQIRIPLGAWSDMEG